MCKNLAIIVRLFPQMNGARLPVSVKESLMHKGQRRSLDGAQGGT